MRHHTATYSPEDNKLRLYPACRLDADEYARVKAAGFKWAPKQELFVAPAWTPEREDLLIEMCGEIGDEDTSLVQRAEAKADRLEDLSDKRRAEAASAHAVVSSIADNIPLGQPILVGHHSERRARKDAERIEAGMRRAVGCWEAAEYWKHRAAGAIRAAKYKEQPDVRARRIKKLESEQRKEAKQRDLAALCLRFWKGETAAKGGGFLDPLDVETAKSVCNSVDRYGVTLPDGERYWSAWGALDDGKITPAQLQAQRLTGLPKLIERQERWVQHYENRLAYERAMLQEQGGTVADRNKPEKGGACRCWASPGFGKGWSYIVKVNRVSVTVLRNFGNGGRNFTETMPFDKLHAIMSAAEVQAARDAGRLMETEDETGFFLVADLTARKADSDPAPDPETKLREYWTAQGIPPTRQEELIAEIAAKAQPGAKVGPFTIPVDFEAMKESLKAGVQVVTAPNLFPTPPDVARQVVELADIRPGHSVLEPSAGTGALLSAIGRSRIECKAVAVEINSCLADKLASMFVVNVDVRCADFLECNGDLGTFDRIVMNPPFDHGEDIKHIQHARKFLKPGGRLVAICANGPRQRDTLVPIAEDWINLPDGTFKDQGTNVNAAIVVIDAAQDQSRLPTKQRQLF